ncbi:hypothetical protein ILUMI_25482 [Ignelater luminosus]|uniref:Solute carrier family 46 member 3 n=1 Tax=Ignelater luminosus TaxID=2038154 RepID=A0A8K0FXW2_IGNLU|nr:hypothetical protein ILUMI_25482 [Ignelater luminosus]
MVCGPAKSNLHFEKACKVNAGFNDTICDAIVSGTYRQMNFTEENNVVQSYLTFLHSWEVPVSSIVPVLLVIIVGSYSDRHKIRKPFLLMPIFGDAIAIVGSILNVIYMRQWPLEIQAVADRIIPSLFGAEKLLIMISYAYIADVSSVEMRTIRMAVIPILLNIIIPVVQALSGILFRRVGYMPVFLLSLSLFVISFLYGIFMIKESKQPEKKSDNSLKDIFNKKNATEPFKLLVKYKGSQRTNFICVLFLTFIHTTVNGGEHSIFFLFTQAVYQWTVVEFSYFTTTRTVVNFFGLSVAVPLFSNVLHLSDIIIIVISYLDVIFVNVIFTVFQSPVGLYVGQAFAVLKPPGHAATRSQLTKYVDEDDMAKAFSLNIIVAALASIFSAQLYNRWIYEHTRRTFPQAFFLFGIAAHSLGIIMLM